MLESVLVGPIQIVHMLVCFKPITEKKYKHEAKIPMSLTLASPSVCPTCPTRGLVFGSYSRMQARVTVECVRKSKISGLQQKLEHEDLFPQIFETDE